MGMDEEPSELEKLCTAAHAEVMGFTRRKSSTEVIEAGWGIGTSEDEWDQGGVYGGASDAETATTHPLLEVQVSNFVMKCANPCLQVFCIYSYRSIRLFTCSQLHIHDSKKC